MLVLVDRDDDDCIELKKQLELAAVRSGLPTLTRHADRAPIVASRIVCEELEAWFFGDFPALHQAYPRLPETLTGKSKYRDPDAIRGAAEQLERLLQRAGCFRVGVSKLDVATAVAPHMDVTNNRSASSQAFVSGLRRLVE
ncbi:MAG: DUF4276 family protein [Propionibacteriaceae bacterium]|nr:DUF4276 family protein [Propionibacteriaceae bacterium]